MKKHLILGALLAMFALYAQGCKSTSKDISSEHYKKTTTTVASKIVVE